MCNPIAPCKRSAFPLCGSLRPLLGGFLLPGRFLSSPTGPWWTWGVPEPPWQGLLAEQGCWLGFLTGACAPSTHSVQSAWGDREKCGPGEGGGGGPSATAGGWELWETLGVREEGVGEEGRRPEGKPPQGGERPLCGGGGEDSEGPLPWPLPPPPPPQPPAGVRGGGALQAGA